MKEARIAIGISVLSLSVSLYVSMRSIEIQGSLNLLCSESAEGVNCIVESFNLQAVESFQFQTGEDLRADSRRVKDQVAALRNEALRLDLFVTGDDPAREIDSYKLAMRGDA